MISDIPCDQRSVGRWGQYYASCCQNSNSALAVEAMAHIDPKSLGHALDLGAGSMNDTKYFLGCGFRQVTALDACDDAEKYAAEVARQKWKGSFQFEKSFFADFEYGFERFDLVHANYSLPFHGRTGFTELIKAILDSLKVGGIFSTVFFGPNDGFRQSKPGLAYLTEGEVSALLQGLEVLLFKSSEFDGHACAGSERKPKHWHTHRVIARRTLPVL